MFWEPGVWFLRLGVSGHDSLQLQLSFPNAGVTDVCHQALPSSMFLEDFPLEGKYCAIKSNFGHTETWKKKKAAWTNPDFSSYREGLQLYIFKAPTTFTIGSNEQKSKDYVYINWWDIMFSLKIGYIVLLYQKITH